MTEARRIRVTTLGDLLTRAVEKWPHNKAVVFPETSPSYADLLVNARRRAKSLMGAGVKPGDHIGILALNMIEFVESLYAIALVGGVAVLINARYRGDELIYVLENADVRLLLTTSRFSDHVNFCSLLHTSYPELTHANDRMALELQQTPLLRSIVLFEPVDKAGMMASDQFDLLADGISDHQLDVRRSQVLVRDPCLMMYTSGTTSKPKGCRLSHEAIVRSSSGQNSRFRIKNDDCIWDPLPMFHMSAILPMLAATWSGATYLTDTLFKADAALRQIYTEQPTILFPAFPAIMADLLEHPDFDAAKLPRVRLLNNVAPPAQLRDNMRRIPQAVHVSAYGLTEAAGVSCHGSPDDDEETRATTSGRPFDGVMLRVVDPDTCMEVAPGTEGEMQVCGYSLFEGYYKSPERNAEAFTADGWFRTGDLCAMDVNGCVSFRGRLKDMLKIGGENVAALEIEAFLTNHPAIKMVQVVGAPDSRLLEVAAAFIELHPNMTCSAEELLDFCRGKIASFKIPRYIRFVKEWPMSATKVQKFVLLDRIRNELAAERPW